MHSPFVELFQGSILIIGKCSRQSASLERLLVLEHSGIRTGGAPWSSHRHGRPEEKPASPPGIKSRKPSTPPRAPDPGFLSHRIGEAMGDCRWDLDLVDVLLKHFIDAGKFAPALLPDVVHDMLLLPLMEFGRFRVHRRYAVFWKWATKAFRAR